MMKLVVLFLGLFLFVSCGDTAGEGAEKVSPDGPEFEITVDSFDSQNNKTVVKITNRNSEAIKGIRGRLNFMDSNGENLMTATGRIIDSPFSLSQNPQIVKSMESTTFELMNEVPENTVSIILTEVIVTLKNDEKLEI